MYDTNAVMYFINAVTVGFFVTYDEALRVSYIF